METKTNKRLPISLRTVIAVPFSLPALFWFSTYKYQLGWSGFGKAAIESMQAKTLWDWMNLLLLPLIIIVGVLLLNRSRRIMERQQGKEQSSVNREIASDRQKEEALQAYFDRMADLLLKDKLSKFSPEDVRAVARIRTLTILRGLDPRRKGLVLLFLKDSSLIDREAVIDLCAADLKDVSLPFASLGRINLSEADMKGADLQGAGLSKSYLSGTNLSGSNLVGANLAGVDLFDANLSGADLSHAKLNRAKLNGANLRGCRLQEANLSEADLSGVNLSVTDLIGADLRGAKLGGAKLAGANLSEADLSQADLSGTQLSETDLDKVKSLEGAILPDGTKHD